MCANECGQTALSPCVQVKVVRPCECLCASDVIDLTPFRWPSNKDFAYINKGYLSMNLDPGAQYLTSELRPNTIALDHAVVLVLLAWSPDFEP